MEIREALKSDVTEIVELLKLSLGQNLIPKSERFWKWKHLENPFGRSFTLVAILNGKIVGFRSFMRWEWRYKGEILKAVRAVDTATHPEYQGRGIFKSLTMKCLEVCRENNIDFVFNTPNEKSKPGYLKMGWCEVGRLPVKIKVLKPFSILKNIFRKTNQFVEPGKHYYNLQDAIKKQNDLSANSTKMRTNVSRGYLAWRYIDVPVCNYYGYWVESLLIVFRIKKNRLGVELRIVDAFGDYSVFSKCIKKLKSEINADFITVSGLKHVRLGGLALTLNLGPIVTMKQINKENQIEGNGFKEIEGSLGDLELF